MPKKLFYNKQKFSPDGFRYRGTQRTRLENLTDTIFGISITLLVIASEVPASYVELQASMYSFIGFIFCILLLLGTWNAHSNFFLHYGLETRLIKLLNSLFLFILLFYVYPLKYLFTYVGTGLYLVVKRSAGDHSEGLKLAINNFARSELTVDQWQDLTMRFGLGLLCIHLILMLLHIIALRHRGELKLKKREVYITNTFIQKYALLVLISFTSIMIVMIWGGNYSDVSGMVYLSVPIILPIHNNIRKRRMGKRQKKQAKLPKNKSPEPIEQEEKVET